MCVCVCVCVSVCVCVCQYRCVCCTISGREMIVMCISVMAFLTTSLYNGNTKHCFPAYIQTTMYRCIVDLSLSVPPVFPPLKERLGDAKEQVREQGQQLIQQIFQNVVGSPQTFLDKLMDVCLIHKNWRVKEQGLLCLSRTLS